MYSPRPAGNDRCWVGTLQITNVSANTRCTSSSRSCWCHFSPQHGWAAGQTQDLHITTVQTMRISVVITCWNTRRSRQAIGEMKLKWNNFISFLADRINGRAYATVLRLSVCLSSSVTLCIVAKQCVLEQKLLLKAYRKSYMSNRLVPKWMTLTFV